MRRVMLDNKVAARTALEHRGVSPKALALLAFLSLLACSDHKPVGVAQNEAMPITASVSSPLTHVTSEPAIRKAIGPAALPLTPNPNSPVIVEVSPRCVSLGSRLKITATTAPSAKVIYQAIYSNSRSGAAPPYGSGYGGNSSGEADKRGHFSDAFIVASSAPPGVARLDVVTGSQEGQGYGSA